MDNIRITIETNANDAAKTFENLANSFNDADNGAKDLRKEIRELKSDIYKMTPGTEEYANALVQLGDKMNTLGDIQRDLKASTGGLDTVFQTTTTAVGTMASGFQAAMGVVTLFGGDTEELQKTFIQLQAVMSIATGLKGFAGFIKYTNTASASLKAFIAKMTLSTKAVKADTKEKTKDALATKGLDTAQKGAAGSTNLLTAGFHKLTAAMAANPIGLIIVALTALIAIISKVVSGNKAAKESQDKWNAAMGNAKAPVKELNEVLSDYDRETERTMNQLRAVGASTEDLNEYEEKRLLNLKKEIELEGERIKYVNEHTSYIMREVNAQNLGYASYKKMNEALGIYAEKLTEIDKRLEDISDAKSPIAEYNAMMKKELEEMDILIAEGLASTKDKYLKQIELAEEGKNQILAKYRGSRGGRNANMSEVDKQAIATYDSQIQNLTQQIKIIDANHRKEVRASARKTVETYQKNFDDLSKGISNELTEYVDDMKKILKKFYELDIEGASLGGGLMRKVRELLLGADDEDGAFADMVNQLKKQVNDAKEKLSPQQFDALIAQIDGMRVEYENSINAFVNSLMRNGTDKVSPKFTLPSGNNLKINNFTAILAPFSKDVDDAVAAVTQFRERIQNLDDAFKAGEITPAEYMESLIRNVGNWKQAVESNLEKIPGIIQQHINEIPGFSNLNEEEQSAVVAMIESYLKRSMYIPDSEIEGIVSDAKSIMFDQLDKVIDGIEDQYDNTITYIETRFQGMSNFNKNYGVQSFLTRFLGGTFWGTGVNESYNLAKQQTEEVWNAYKTMADKEIEEINRLMASAGADVALKEELSKRKLAIQAQYNLEMQKYYGELEDLEHDHLVGLVNNMSSVLSATSSLGSAFADYYDELSKDTELSEKEQMEYTLKSLEMKRAMAVVNIAQGIVAAIAGAMELGFPMGPIVGALESAAVAASGAVQIANINRQIRELNGSSGGSDTPSASGLVDRVITANAQNTDQREQLNAQYGSNEDRRVYITQSDIDNGRKTRSVAVTQNGF